MLTIQQIKEAPERIIARLAVKGFDGTAAINEILELDTMRRQSQLSNDTKAAELNRLAASIGQLMKAGKKDEAEQAKQQVAALKGEQKDVADSLADYLARHPEIDARCLKNGRCEYLTTENPEKFGQSAGLFLNKPITAKKIIL